MSFPVEDIRVPKKMPSSFSRMLAYMYNIYIYSLIVFPLISRFPLFEVSLATPQQIAVLKNMCKSRKGVLEMGDPQSSWSNDWMIFGGTPETSFRKPNKFLLTLAFLEIPVDFRTWK